MARFVGVLNVLELQVRDGVARREGLEFPVHGLSEGQKMRVGFRPYAVQVSPDPGAHRFQAALRRTYFLGLMLRLKLVLDSSPTIPFASVKKNFPASDRPTASAFLFKSRPCRILSKVDDPLSVEVATAYETTSGKT